MKFALLLVAVLIWALPPALALNCTLFSGEAHTLCTVVDPLPLEEDYKWNLMRSDLYGSVEVNNAPVNLHVPLNEAEVTLNQIYEENISFGAKFALFLFFNYAFFSYLTKSSIMRKWLTADY